MSIPAKAHEPTMEEILASIRRIISDDDRAAKPGQSVVRKPADPSLAPKPALVEAPAAPVDLDVRDAEAMLAEFDEPAAALPEQKAPFEDDLDVLELTEETEVAEEANAAPDPVPAFEARRTSAREPVIAAPPPSRPEETVGPLMTSEALLSASADRQVSEAFGSLANTILAGNARTLDDIVREMLRPMLRAWLDDNLPPLVERLVRQEIERVARGGR